MKPSVIADSNGRTGSGTNNRPPTGSNSNGINIPINHQYGGGGGGHQQPPSAHSFANDANAPDYSSPSSRQFPHHFQDSFGFDPDIDSIFPDTGLRSRLGSRMQDPFGTFGSRKRCGNEPNQSGGSSYFDDDPDFFPQFGTLGNRRRGAGAGNPGAMPTMDAGSAAAADGDDFFDRLPPEFRQYIPEGFGMAHRRSGSTGPPQSPRTPQQQQQQQQYAPQYYPKTYAQPDFGTQTSSGVPQQSPKILRDAAIQTEGSQRQSGGGGDYVDGGGHLNQHGLRNTVDLGVKSTPEDHHGMRAHSAPPNEQPAAAATTTAKPRVNRNTPPPPFNNSNFSTQTSPQVGGGTEPNLQRAHYPTQNQSQPQSQQPSSTQQQQQQQQASSTSGGGGGGSYIRTIPIFVEGRSEPIINSHKEIPNQTQTSAGSTASGKAHHHPPPHQQRPTPLNTQQAAAGGAGGSAEQQRTHNQAGGEIPPQTPHTMESINKIQDIQRDVLDLMGKVEKFTGKRQDKEYAYLDEMLTRNLLKLDTIDTNGKESIRMARKEAIKCIQASINVLEAKAEENAKAAAAAHEDAGSKATNAANEETNRATLTVDGQMPIPLPPPPENHKNSNSVKDADGHKAKETVTESETVVDAKTE